MAIRSSRTTTGVNETGTARDLLGYLPQNLLALRREHCAHSRLKRPYRAVAWLGEGDSATLYDFRISSRKSRPAP